MIANVNILLREIWMVPIFAMIPIFSFFFSSVLRNCSQWSVKDFMLCKFCRFSLKVKWLYSYNSPFHAHKMKSPTFLQYSICKEEVMCLCLMNTVSIICHSLIVHIGNNWWLTLKMTCHLMSTLQHSHLVFQLFVRFRFFPWFKFHQPFFLYSLDRFR